MEKEDKKQYLIIEPKNEIVFKGPFDMVVTEYFTLSNPTEWTIAFKVKTTAPKRYCVRPNNGLVAPKASCQIAIMLQPAIANLEKEKNKHKFMIQSMILPPNTSAQDIDELFKSSSDEIINSKFKCVFLNNASADSTRHATKEFLSTNITDAICSGENVTNQHISDHETAVLHSTSNNDSAKARITFFESSNQSESNNEDTKAPSSGLNQELKDENSLNSANEEIQMLKEKLSQLQRYASRFAESKNNSVLLKEEKPNNLSFMLSAIVVFISFLIGIFFGKNLF